MILIPASLALAQMPKARDLVAPLRAQRMETLIAQAFPTATLDWEREQLVFPDGRRVKFTFRLYSEHPRDGDVLVVASRAPDEEQEKAIRRPRPIAAC